MLTYELLWHITQEQLPLIRLADAQATAELAGHPSVLDSTGVIIVVGMELQDEFPDGFWTTQRWRVRIADVDQPLFQKLMKSRDSLVSLELLYHEVEERPAWPVRNVPLHDGRTADMYADAKTGDMLETRVVWERHSSG